MAWQLSGRSMELCNCKMLCPCWLGPGVPLSFVWPGNFFSGNGTARCYIGDDAQSEQRQELEAIFTGKRGRPVGAVVGSSRAASDPTSGSPCCSPSWSA